MFALLDTVKLPRDFYYRRPRQLSGGQKQRVGIARAFAGNPSMVIADEPVSSLDVSVAAAVTELLMDIQRKHKTTLLFISHDLSVVRYLADRIVVMYLGQIMERGTTEADLRPALPPLHRGPALGGPHRGPAGHQAGDRPRGQLPQRAEPAEGLPSTRCPRKVGRICDDERPPVQMTAEGHAIACHIPLTELRRVEPVITVRRDERPPKVAPHM